jgi:hypothetical protein
MTDHRPPPPEPEGCLTLSCVSRYKGGTLLAEDVHELAAHRQRLAARDPYRPEECHHCHGRVLHVHDYPERKPRGEPGLPPAIRVVRYICAECRATWRILPAFLARHLWRAWRTVERTVGASPVPRLDPSPAPKPIPKRTAGRWRARLASAARQLVVLLATSGGVLLEEIAKDTGVEGTRRELVDVHAQKAATPPGRRLADLAALVHRLRRGLRLV